ncbi:hypothetical protein SNE40_004255 [Patella caerulea]|uniref:G-protein coupled receptors family 1 profile domain-containing protein n=1 Tax=Patella caerulea TaxID=87958 RepID=A0AAN8K9L1_PATCE
MENGVYTIYNINNKFLTTDEYGQINISQFQNKSSWQNQTAMAPIQQSTSNQEAYYLFFVGALGMFFNLVVILCICVRRNMRRMTSAFLIHASILNFLKAAFCIPFGLNLIAGEEISSCTVQGASYIVIITASAFNLVAMICTEAYTFGETNIGGRSKGTICCVAFGILLVYVASTILHLGPTLIGGYFIFEPNIGSCTFEYGKISGYIAHVMWIIIITLAYIAIIHFLHRLYKEIQSNQPNRVSMLVRNSITIMDDQKYSQSNIRHMVRDSFHRAKIFIMISVAFAVCWYPLFVLIIIDVHFMVSPKVYQAFSFIAWTQGTIEPLLYICFDRNLKLLAQYIYCDRHRQYDMETLAYLMSRHRQASQQNCSSNQEQSQQSICRHCHSEKDGAASSIRSTSPNSTVTNEERDETHHHHQTQTIPQEVQC